MPTYSYSCSKGHFFDRYLPLAEYDAPQTCACGEAGRKLFPRVHLMKRREVYYDSPIDGRPITSEAARREDLARNNCQEYDPEMKKDAERRRREASEALDRSIDETVEREVAAMPSEKRERLDAELTRGGLDLEYTRSTAEPA